MPKDHSNQKYIDKLLTQLQSFVNTFETAIPGVLKEFKNSFSNMPGDLSKIYNNVQGLIEYVHEESKIMIEAIGGNQFQYIPVNVKSIAVQLWSIDGEVEKLKNKYSDNGLLQVAVQHFHNLNSELKKVLNAIINSSWNIINKAARLPEGEYHNHNLGTKINDDRLIKKKRG